MKIQLHADTVRGFVEKFLLARYEEARPVPWFHREWWHLVCSNHPRVVLAAPRSHAKSTAINHAYGLAASLFQQHPFQIKVSRTYDLAVEKLRQAKEELIANETIKGVFRLKRFIRDTENDFIAELSDGYQFRMSALGMEQAVRGKSWGTVRPTLIQGDDMEDDEQVMSPERRDKAMRWVMNTLLPIGSVNTKFRIYGTVLHTDSVLMRLLKNKSWKGKIYEACDAEMSEGSILWPEMFPRERLQEIKDMYASAGNLQGFNMEYRNIATDADIGFFRKEDFRAMTDEDKKKIDDKRLTYYVGGDYAISTKQSRDRTVFVVGGVDTDGLLHIVDVRAGRWDALEILEEMFSIHEAWHPDEWYVESGSILKALQGALELEQRKRNVYLPLSPMIPSKDKASRARSIQARMRARGVRFDQNTSWFSDLQEECTAFPRGEHDDAVDGLSWLGVGLSRMVVPNTQDEDDEIERELMMRENTTFGFGGRSPVTGY